MKKSILSLIVFLLGIMPMIGQISNFKLSDYKLADYKLHLLDLRFTSNNSFRNNTLMNGNNLKSYQLSQDFKSNYFFERYTRNYSGSVEFGLESTFNGEKDDSDLVYRKYNSFTLKPFVYTNHNFYSANNFFVSLSFSGSIQQNNSNTTSRRNNSGEWSESNVVKSTKTISYTGISAGAGKGRIERVTDAIHAVYILKELHQNNSLTREPTHEEILGLAKRITVLKKERVLDSRLHKIRELNQVDSLLRSLDLLANSDLEYFSALNDMWDFGGLQPRFSGLRVGINSGPSYSYNKMSQKQNGTNNDMDSEDKTNAFTNNIDLTLVWAKPIGHKYQSTFQVSQYYNFVKTKDSQYDETGNSLISHLVYTFDYFPNTRTKVGFSTWLSGSKTWTNQKYDSDNDYDEERLRFGSNSSINISYYFTPQLRLNGSITIDTSYDKDFVSPHPDKRIDTQLNIGLLYSLF
jgi:hypothetical protein